MAKRLEIRYEDRPCYEIILEGSYEGLPSCAGRLGTEDRRVLIVTDENVAPLYLEEVETRLREIFREVSVLVLKPGEVYKNTDTVASIYEKMVAARLDRHDYLLALGGGVIGDMTGFAAATYMRGIRFIQVPTTLLAQVDSSIGGKTGVDFRAFKNMVGAFHMPSLVYSCIPALRTLDGLQFASGMGEVLKHAMIRDRAYLDYMAEHREAISRRDPEVMEEVVFRSNEIKAAVVEKDPKEHGERQILNFGHTLGHAIEKCSGFSLTHGQCVAYGCLAALELSGGITDSDRQMIRELMQYAGLSVCLPEMDTDEILQAMKMDKKSDRGQARFVLLDRIGHALYGQTVEEQDIRRALKAVRSIEERTGVK